MFNRIADFYRDLKPFQELSGIEKGFRLAGYALCGAAVLGVIGLTAGAGLMLHSFIAAKIGATVAGGISLGGTATLIPSAVATAGGVTAAVAGGLGYMALRSSGRKSEGYAFG